MLQAILNGKARRVSLHDSEDQSWRSLFQRYEDLLTAAFWERICYLPEKSLINFLSSLLQVDISNWGKYESISFWPKYPFPDTLDESFRCWIDDKSKFAEPDVILNFEHAALMVEVKPPAGGQQYQGQWCREIYAWKNNEEAKPILHFLALGNLPQNTSSLFQQLENYFDNVIFHGLEWQIVKEKLQRPLIEWPTQQEKQIITDCLDALALYGIRDPLRPWQPFLHYLSEQNLPASYCSLQGKK